MEDPELLCIRCGRGCRRDWLMIDDNGPLVEVGKPFPGNRYADRATGETVLKVRNRRGGAWREAWTGGFEHYGPKDAPFCRQRCAIDYAIGAARLFAREGRKLVFKGDPR